MISDSNKIFVVAYVALRISGLKFFICFLDNKWLYLVTFIFHDIGFDRNFGKGGVENSWFETISIAFFYQSWLYLVFLIPMISDSDGFVVVVSVALTISGLVSFHLFFFLSKLVVFS